MRNREVKTNIEHACKNRKLNILLIFFRKKNVQEKRKVQEKNILQPASSFIQFFFLFLKQLFFKKNIDLMQQQIENKSEWHISISDTPQHCEVSFQHPP